MKNRILSPLKKAYLSLMKYNEERLPLKIYKSRTLVSLYYFLLNKSFRREVYAVMNGKVKHLKEAQTNKGNYFLLVRNTHRLEKGLLMKPRKPVFGKAYIEETLKNFQAIWNRDEMKQNLQMKWFYDVLHEYFENVGSDDYVDGLKARFFEFIRQSDCAFGDKSIPYHRNIANFSNIRFDEFYKLAKQRRSVRWFLDKEVPRELIDKAVLAALQSPSACNRQPFEFKIFDEKSLVKEIVDLPMGTTGYGHSIPVIVVLVGNLDAYYNERDRHVIYIDAALAAMSFMFALETLNLGSCAINWPDIEYRERKMERKLGLSPHQRPIMCIGLGFPDPEGMVAFSEKRDINIIRSYN